jgi:hypothetical protein
VNPHNTVDEISFKVPEADLSPGDGRDGGADARPHRLRPGQPNSFEVETAEESLSFWNRSPR